MTMGAVVFKALKPIISKFPEKQYSGKRILKIRPLNYTKANMIKLLKLLNSKISTIFKNPTIFNEDIQKMNTICKNVFCKTHVQNCKNKFRKIFFHK